MRSSREPISASLCSSTLPVPKVFTIDRDRLGHADGVGELDFSARGQAGSNHVLGDVAGHVAGRAIDLRRIFAGERAAAVTAHAAVGIDDDFASGEAGIAVRTADDEAAGGIDVELGVGIHHVGRASRHR